MKLLPALFFFVKSISQQNHIDESHSIGHSMKVLHHACDIYKESLHQFPKIYNQENVIYTSTILHYMCDKKYVDQKEGLTKINDLLQHKMTYLEIEKVKEIMRTMSYSYVKTHDFPDHLGHYTTAYHIVREADLLASYDFDRAMIYHMYKTNEDVFKSFENSKRMFQTRVFTYVREDMFKTRYSKRKALELELESLKQIQSWEHIMKSYEKNEIL